MSTRRRMLAATASLASLSLTGCLGYTVVDETEYEITQTHLDENASRADDFEARAADLEGERDAADARLVRRLYVYGHSLATEATADYDDGLAAWEAAEYRTAEFSLDRAVTLYTASAAAFRDCDAVARDVDRGDRSVIEDAITHTTDMADGVGEFAEAAGHAAAERWDDAEDASTEAHHAIDGVFVDLPAPNAVIDG